MTYRKEEEEQEQGENKTIKKWWRIKHEEENNKRRRNKGAEAKEWNDEEWGDKNECIHSIFSKWHAYVFAKWSLSSNTKGTLQWNLSALYNYL